MPEFKREDRYVVLKRKDLERLPVLLQEALWGFLEQAEFSLPKRQYVVVESDWPEYEVAFKLIEARVTGKSSEIDDLRAALEAANKEIDVLTAERNLYQNACDRRDAKLAEMNLQHISDFGKLQDQEPVMIYNGRCIIDCGDGGHQDVTMLKMIAAGSKLYAAAGARPGFDLITHLRRQIAFSQRTFGPGERTAGVLDHIRKELIEIEDKPTDLTEWVDLMLLAFDGAWRAGHTAEAICQGIDTKQTKNEARTWPDWRTVAPGKAIEHVRSAE